MSGVTPSYLGLQFLIGSGDAVSGVTAIASMTDTTGLAVWGDSVCGSTATATIEDIALLVYGDSVCGATFSSEIEEDIVFIDAPFYGDSVCGVTGYAKMFIDPSEPTLRRYLPAGGSK